MACIACCRERNWGVGYEKSPAQRSGGLCSAQSLPGAYSTHLHYLLRNNSKDIKRNIIYYLHKIKLHNLVTKFTHNIRKSYEMWDNCNYHWAHTTNCSQYVVEEKVTDWYDYIWNTLYYETNLVSVLQTQKKIHWDVSSTLWLVSRAAVWGTEASVMRKSPAARSRADTGARANIVYNQIKWCFTRHLGLARFGLSWLYCMKETRYMSEQLD